MSGHRRALTPEQEARVRERMHANFHPPEQEPQGDPVARKVRRVGVLIDRLLEDVGELREEIARLDALKREREEEG